MRTPLVLNAVYPLISLAIEAERVVELRLVRLAGGGPAAWIEAQLMVTEKITAAAEALGTLMTGGSPETVVARYREHVAANAARLDGRRLS